MRLPSDSRYKSANKKRGKAIAILFRKHHYLIISIMAQSGSIQPTAQVTPTSTATLIVSKTKKVERCQQCPYFTNYDELSGNGWCNLNAHTSKTYFQPSIDCQFKIASLNLPSDYFNVSVHIISKLIVEQDGYPVPDDERVVEVKVPEINLNKVVEALSRVININDYQIFSFWQTEIEDHDVNAHFYEF
jgi:hypothetical protein